MTTELTRARRRRPHLKRLLRHVALTAMAILMLYPIIWMIISSLRPDEMIFSQGVFSLSDLSFDNYREGWDALRDRKSTRLNSSHVAISYAVCCLENKRITS